jgi:hypothetical protein
LGGRLHANSEGFALAVRADLRSAFSAESEDLEIGHCSSHRWLPIAVGFAMTLLSASLVFEFWGDLGGFVITTRYGVRDLCIGDEFLLWDAIEGVSNRKRRGHRAVVLTLTPALKRQLGCVGRRRARRQDIAMRRHRVVISQR